MVCFKIYHRVWGLDSSWAQFAPGDGWRADPGDGMVHVASLSDLPISTLLPIQH